MLKRKISDAFLTLWYVVWNPWSWVLLVVLSIFVASVIGILVLVDYFIDNPDVVGNSIGVFFGKLFSGLDKGFNSIK